MSKTIKNVLLGFTLLCVIILIIFTVELIVINRNSDSGGERMLASDANTPAGTAIGTDETDKTTELPTKSNSASNQNENIPKASDTQSAGKRYELLYSITESLVLYASEELFKYEDVNGLVKVLTYTDGGDASLRISFESMPLGIEKCAESLLDNYLGGNESHVGDSGQILHSSLSGIPVSGVNDGETYEAWVNGITDNDIGMAFIIRYRSDEQKNALYTVLDTLALVQN